ncbi:MAG: PQQ-binding-like beta-propeller repeat protein [Pirellulaceae bacterium]|nr:PQQ-binding-like beta-propeller repeat protein [Pirellulaceae bacterium]
MPGRFHLPIPTALLLLGLFVACAEREVWGQGFPLQIEPELSADVYLDEVGQAARFQLEQAKEFVAKRQWDEAIESLRRVMENDGDRVIALPPPVEPARHDFQRYVTLRQLGQILLTGFSRTAPEALELYRQRVDPLALRWYQEAVAARDQERLERLVDQFFTSSHGDDALLALGELALEQGNYLLARESWERISPQLRSPALPDPAAAVRGDGPVWLPGRPLWQSWRGLDLAAHWDELSAALRAATVSDSWLVYPDTGLKLADVRARLVLVSLLEGSRQRAAWELDLFGRLHPEEQGTLGGRSGLYRELLAELFADSANWPVPWSREADWPTFGGNGARRGRAPDTVDVRQRPLWQVELPVLAAGSEHLGELRQRVAEDARGLLSYHPVVRGGSVYVATGPRVDDLDAFDLRTGDRLWRGLPNLPPPPQAGRTRLAPGGIFPGIARPERFVGVPRYTLTSHGNWLLTRIGSEITGPGGQTDLLRSERSAVAAVDVEAERKLLFKLDLEGPEWSGDWGFEGTPLADSGHLYAALRRRDDVRAQLHLACFDARNQRLRWRKLVAAAETIGHGQWNERSHTLLSMQSGMLFVNTNLGVIASLRADNGQVRWITRYRRAAFHPQDSSSEDRHFFRDLTPCVLYHNLVLAAPADCDRIFGLDAATGQLIWATAPGQATDVVHLLGVGAGNLLASGDQLYWIQAETGRFLGRFPDAGRDAVRGYGRGQLAGDQVYWPTREALYVLDQAGPRQTRQPIPLAEMGVSGGNVVVAGGVLLVAGADHLTAFDVAGPRPTTE